MTKQLGADDFAGVASELKDDEATLLTYASAGDRATLVALQEKYIIKCTVDFLKTFDIKDESAGVAKIIDFGRAMATVSIQQEMLAAQYADFVGLVGMIEKDSEGFRLKGSLEELKSKKDRVQVLQI